MPRRTVRSRFVKYAVTATWVPTGQKDNWTILLQGNRIREDRQDWLRTAYEAGFADIRLSRVKETEKV